jgi:hypothetical protein
MSHFSQPPKISDEHLLEHEPKLLNTKEVSLCPNIKTTADALLPLRKKKIKHEIQFDLMGRCKPENHW